MPPNDLKSLLTSLPQIREREAKATPGPWSARLNSESDTMPPQIDAAREAGLVSFPQVAWMMWMCHETNKEAEAAMVKQTEDDCTFIANARADIPNLLALTSALLGMVRDYPPAHYPMCRGIPQRTENGGVSCGECDCGLSERLRALGLDK